MAKNSIKPFLSFIFQAEIVVRMITIEATTRISKEVTIITIPVVEIAVAVNQNNEAVIMAIRIKIIAIVVVDNQTTIVADDVKLEQSTYKIVM